VKLKDQSYSCIHSAGIDQKPYQNANFRCEGRGGAAYRATLQSLPSILRTVDTPVC